jgi:hypothetical protein
MLINKNPSIWWKLAEGTGTASALKNVMPVQRLLSA